MYEYTPEQLDYATMVMTLFVAGFVATVFVWGVCKPHWFKPIEFSDKFDLGYIEDREQKMVLPMAELFEEEVKIPTARQTRRKVMPKPKARPKARPKVRPKAAVKPKAALKPKVVVKQKPATPKPTHSAEFIEECAATLSALGCKISVARRDAKAFLKDNPQIKTAEEFIIGIFKK